mgnify:CR=1 FL=1
MTVKNKIESIELIEKEFEIKIDCDNPAIKSLIEHLDNGYITQSEFRQWVVVENELYSNS